MQLPPDDEVIMVSGHAPIRASKLRYYEDRNFPRRVLPPPTLSAENYLDRPDARADDWSGQGVVASKSTVASAMNDSGMSDEGGLRRQPELEAITTEQDVISFDDALAVLDDDASEVLDPSSPRLARQMSRTARLAALDADEGIAL